jgi:predicted cytidylate kinase
MVIITISGLPGSGTTTVANILHQKLGLKYVYTGDLFRALAKEYNMDVIEFGKYAEEHPEIDREFERRQAQLARAGNVLIEGRLAGWVAHNEGIAAVKVWLDAPLPVRVARVATREPKDYNTILQEVKMRETAERSRYIKTYNFDLNNKSIYDLVIDTTNHTPEEIADMIIMRLRELGRDSTYPLVHGDKK